MEKMHAIKKHKPRFYIVAFTLIAIGFLALFQVDGNTITAGAVGIETEDQILTLNHKVILNSDEQLSFSEKITATTLTISFIPSEQSISLNDNTLEIESPGTLTLRGYNGEITVGETLSLDGKAAAVVFNSVSLQSNDVFLLKGRDIKFTSIQAEESNFDATLSTIKASLTLDERLSYDLLGESIQMKQFQGRLVIDKKSYLEGQANYVKVIGDKTSILLN